MQRLFILLLLMCAIVPAFGQVTTLFPMGSNWKYNDSGIFPGTTWFQSAYSDSQWASGNAELGYGDGDEQTTVSYGPDSGNKHITTYFRKTFYVANPAQFNSINGSVKRDDGIVVYVNGLEVYRNNMPAGIITNSTPASGTVAWPNEDNVYGFSFSPALLVSGNNVIAVEIHQDDPSSSDISFDASLSGEQAAITANVVRGPYLQTATENSVIVRWRTDVPTDSKVQFGTSLGNLSQHAQEYAFTTEHEVHVTGLLPATNYYYTIGSYAQQLTQPASSHYFKTNPVVGTSGDYRFWVIGDSGMGNDDQRNVRDGFLTTNQGQHIDGWIMLGDNAYGSGIDDGTQSHYQDGVFENMYEPILQNTVLWPALGNHDYNNHIPFSPSPAYFDIFSLPVNAEAGGVPSGTEKYYSYNYGNIHFIVLDSYDEDRSASGPMATWMVADLQQNTAEWTIAYWHHPPYTKGSHNSDNWNFLDGELVEMRENILPILEQYGVDLVLNGHSHCYERSFLLDSHYGYSDELTASMILDNGSGGGVNGDCPYQKTTTLTKAHQGTVYAVVGCSSKLSDVASDWPHPVMSHADATHLGSMLLTVRSNELSAEFLGTDGSVMDQFTIVKNAGIRDTLVVCQGDEVVMTPSFPGEALWLPGGVFADSLLVTPQFATMYLAEGYDNCIADTFFIEMSTSPDCNLGSSEQTVNGPEVVLQTVGSQLEVSWKGFTGNNVQLVLYAADGRVLRRQSFHNDPGVNQVFLPASGLHKGVYFLHLSDRKQSVIRQFIHQQ